MSQPRGFYSIHRRIPLLLLLLPALLLAGCAHTSTYNSETLETAGEQAPRPYYPAEFRDLQIPHELDWQRDKSMVVNTDSFAGGVLFFSGRVDVDSLTDFFLTSMRNNGWKLVGSVKYKKVLLAFTKPHKTCTIIISETDITRRAEVNIYITEDIASREGNSPDTLGQNMPFTF